MNDVGSTSAVLIVCLLGSVGKKRGGEGAKPGDRLEKYFHPLYSRPLFANGGVSF